MDERQPDGDSFIPEIWWKEAIRQGGSLVDAGFPRAPWIPMRRRHRITRRWRLLRAEARQRIEYAILALRGEWPDDPDY